MLAYNVAGLLGSSPGTDRRFAIREASLPFDDQLRLAAPLTGSLRLSRTTRSILARVELTTALAGTCSRCLGSAVSPVTVSFLEEALPSIDLVTGLPIDRSAEPDALRIDEHHVLDLEAPVRDAIAMAEPIAPLCRPDCRGLCTECGADLNEAPAHTHGDPPIDSRLAALAAWRPPAPDR